MKNKARKSVFELEAQYVAWPRHIPPEAAPNPKAEVEVVLMSPPKVGVVGFGAPNVAAPNTGPVRDKVEMGVAEKSGTTIQSKPCSRRRQKDKSIPLLPNPTVGLGFTGKKDICEGIKVRSFRDCHQSQSGCSW
jgi:hypothetical protein